MKETKKYYSIFIKVIGSIIGSIIFFYLLKYIFWWVPNLAEILNYFKTPLKESLLYRIIALIIFIIIAFSLFRLKKKMPTAFGLFELVAGGWTIWMTFTQSFENDIMYALTIGAGLFLIVNGLENIEKEKK